MALKRWLVRQVSSFLSDYLEGIHDQNLRTSLSLEVGEVEIRHVRVQPGLLADQHLRLLSSDVSVSARIPWRNLGSEPTVITVRDIWVEVQAEVPSASADGSAEEEALKRWRLRRRRQVKAAIAREHAAAAAAEGGEGRRRSVAARLGHAALRQLQVRVEGLQVRLHPESAGAPPLSLSCTRLALDEGGSTDGSACVPPRVRQHPASLDKMLEVNGLFAQLHYLPHGMPAEEGAASAEGRRESLRVSLAELQRLLEQAQDAEARDANQRELRKAKAALQDEVGDRRQLLGPLSLDARLWHSIADGFIWLSVQLHIGQDAAAAVLSPSIMRYYCARLAWYSAASGAALSYAQRARAKAGSQADIDASTLEVALPSGPEYVELCARRRCGELSAADECLIQTVEDVAPVAWLAKWQLRCDTESGEVLATAPAASTGRGVLGWLRRGLSGHSDTQGAVDDSEQSAQSSEDETGDGAARAGDDADGMDDMTGIEDVDRPSCMEVQCVIPLCTIVACQLDSTPPAGSGALEFKGGVDCSLAIATSGAGAVAGLWQAAWNADMTASLSSIAVLLDGEPLMLLQQDAREVDTFRASDGQPDAQGDEDVFYDADSDPEQDDEAGTEVASGQAAVRLAMACVRRGGVASASTPAHGQLPPWELRVRLKEEPFRFNLSPKTVRCALDIFVAVARSFSLARHGESSRGGTPVASPPQEADLQTDGGAVSGKASVAWEPEDDAAPGDSLVLDLDLDVAAPVLRWGLLSGGHVTIALGRLLFRTCGTAPPDAEAVGSEKCSWSSFACRCQLTEYSVAAQAAEGELCQVYAPSTMYLRAWRDECRDWQLHVDTALMRWAVSPVVLSVVGQLPLGVDYAISPLMGLLLEKMSRSPSKDSPKEPDAEHAAADDASPLGEASPSGDDAEAEEGETVKEAAASSLVKEAAVDPTHHRRPVAAGGGGAARISVELSLRCFEVLLCGFSAELEAPEHLALRVDGILAQYTKHLGSFEVLTEMRSCELASEGTPVVSVTSGGKVYVRNANQHVAVEGSSSCIAVQWQDRCVRGIFSAVDEAWESVAAGHTGAQSRLPAIEDETAGMFGRLWVRHVIRPIQAHLQRRAASRLAELLPGFDAPGQPAPAAASPAGAAAPQRPTASAGSPQQQDTASRAPAGGGAMEGAAATAGDALPPPRGECSVEVRLSCEGVTAAFEEWAEANNDPAAPSIQLSFKGAECGFRGFRSGDTAATISLAEAELELRGRRLLTPRRQGKLLGVDILRAAGPRPAMQWSLSWAQVCVLFRQRDYDFITQFLRRAVFGVLPSSRKPEPSGSGQPPADQPSRPAQEAPGAQKAAAPPARFELDVGAPLVFLPTDGWALYPPRAGGCRADEADGPWGPPDLSCGGRLEMDPAAGEAGEPRFWPEPGEGCLMFDFGHVNARGGGAAAASRGEVALQLRGAHVMGATPSRKLARAVSDILRPVGMDAVLRNTGEGPIEFHTSSTAGDGDPAGRGSGGHMSLTRASLTLILDVLAENICYSGRSAARHQAEKSAEAKSAPRDARGSPPVEGAPQSMCTTAPPSSGATVPPSPGAITAALTGLAATSPSPVAEPEWRPAPPSLPAAGAGDPVAAVPPRPRPPPSPAVAASGSSPAPAGADVNAPGDALARPPPGGAERRPPPPADSLGVAAAPSRLLSPAGAGDAVATAPARSLLLPVGAAGSAAAMTPPRSQPPPPPVAVVDGAMSGERAGSGSGVSGSALASTQPRPPPPSPAVGAGMEGDVRLGDVGGGDRSGGAAEPEKKPGRGFRFSWQWPGELLFDVSFVNSAGLGRLRMRSGSFSIDNSASLSQYTVKCEGFSVEDMRTRSRNAIKTLLECAEQPDQEPGFEVRVRIPAMEDSNALIQLVKPQMHIFPQLVMDIMVAGISAWQHCTFRNDRPTQAQQQQQQQQAQRQRASERPPSQPQTPQASGKPASEGGRRPLRGTCVQVNFLDGAFRIAETWGEPGEHFEFAGSVLLSILLHAEGISFERLDLEGGALRLQSAGKVPTTLCPCLEWIIRGEQRRVDDDTRMKRHTCYNFRSVVVPPYTVRMSARDHARIARAFLELVSLECETSEPPEELASRDPLALELVENKLQLDAKIALQGAEVQIMGEEGGLEWPGIKAHTKCTLFEVALETRQGMAPKLNLFAKELEVDVWAHNHRLGAWEPVVPLCCWRLSYHKQRRPDGGPREVLVRSDVAAIGPVHVVITPSFVHLSSRVFRASAGDMRYGHLLAGLNISGLSCNVAVEGGDEEYPLRSQAGVQPLDGLLKGSGRIAQASQPFLLLTIADSPCAQPCRLPLGRESCIPWDTGTAGLLVCRLIMPHPPQHLLLVSSTVCIWNRTPADLEVCFLQPGTTDGQRQQGRGAAGGGSFRPVVPTKVPCSVDAKLLGAGGLPADGPPLGSDPSARGSGDPSPPAVEDRQGCGAEGALRLGAGQLLSAPPEAQIRPGQVQLRVRPAPQAAGVVYEWSDPFFSGAPAGALDRSGVTVCSTPPAAMRDVLPRHWLYMRSGCSSRDEGLSTVEVQAPFTIMNACPCDIYCCLNPRVARTTLCTESDRLDSGSHHCELVVHDGRGGEVRVPAGGHVEVSPLRLDDSGYFHWTYNGKPGRTRPRRRDTNCLLATLNSSSSLTRRDVVWDVTWQCMRATLAKVEQAEALRIGSQSVLPVFDVVAEDMRLTFALRDVTGSLTSWSFPMQAVAATHSAEGIVENIFRGMYVRLNAYRRERVLLVYASWWFVNSTGLDVQLLQPGGPGPMHPVPCFGEEVTFLPQLRNAAGDGVAYLQQRGHEHVVARVPDVGGAESLQLTPLHPCCLRTETVALPDSMRGVSCSIVSLLPSLMLFNRLTGQLEVGFRQEDASVQSATWVSPGASGALWWSSLGEQRVQVAIRPMTDPNRGSSWSAPFELRESRIGAYPVVLKDGHTRLPRLVCVSLDQDAAMLAVTVAGDDCCHHLINQHPSVVVQGAIEGCPIDDPAYKVRVETGQSAPFAGTGPSSAGSRVRLSLSDVADPNQKAHVSIDLFRTAIWRVPLCPTPGADGGQRAAWSASAQPQAGTSWGTSSSSRERQGQRKPVRSTLRVPAHVSVELRNRVAIVRITRGAPTAADGAEEAGASTFEGSLCVDLLKAALITEGSGPSTAAMVSPSPSPCSSPAGMSGAAAAVLSRSESFTVSLAGVRLQVNQTPSRQREVEFCLREVQVDLQRPTRDVVLKSISSKPFLRTKTMRDDVCTLDVHLRRVEIVLGELEVSVTGAVWEQLRLVRRNLAPGADGLAVSEVLSRARVPYHLSRPAPPRASPKLIVSELKIGHAKVDVWCNLYLPDAHYVPKTLRDTLHVVSLGHNKLDVKGAQVKVPEQTLFGDRSPCEGSLGVIVARVSDHYLPHVKSCWRSLLQHSNIFLGGLFSRHTWAPRQRRAGGAKRPLCLVGPGGVLRLEGAATADTSLQPPTRSGYRATL